MFSPSVRDGGPATATRSRRRQRPLSSENIAQQPKAKRQRLPLTQQTFVNPEPQPEPSDSIEVKADKVPVAASKPAHIEKHQAPAKTAATTATPAATTTTPRKELNVRAKKSKHGDRAANKGDGSLVLTSTNGYTVSKLPALPDRIRSDWTVDQHAEVFSSFGYALTLTQTHAIVWPYTSTSQSPETFTFSLPLASKPGDPLPVGCLVSPSAASSEPGLVVVMSAVGKVVYWESISSAATFAFIKKDRSGVEYQIPGFSSSERVVGITNAESAGFILTFNSGRLAYMNVRDNHGRPAISVQYLRTNLSPSSSGIFGSIRHAFSHLSLRGEVAAVRADRSSRVGERNIVALSSKGRLQAWRIHRGGHNESIGEADMRDSIVSALYEVDPTNQEFPLESFEALDFTYVPKGLEPKYLELSRLSDAMGTDATNVQHLLLLVSLTFKGTSRYALVEVILTPGSCQTGMIRPITTYTTPVTVSDGSSTVRPRIYLPRPALVAFAVFDRAAVIASVATPPESPESQLQSDSHVLPASFEDVVDFREDQVYEIVGSGIEETSASAGIEDRSQRTKIKNPAAVLLVRGAGVVRIITTDVDKFASDKPPTVSAKSRLEQAVFFGASKENPLIFDRRQEIKFSTEEVAKAALEVSQEILSSTTIFLSTLPAHLEDNLRAKSAALERLMSHLRSTGVQLSRSTLWQLLHNAEKMHVATLLWKLHESFTASRQADDKKSLIGYIVEFIHQDQKHNPVAKIGEVDPVRHWFINDVYRLQLFVAWAYEVIKVMYKDRLLDDAKLTVMLFEAIQINNTAHLAALKFRENNQVFYGLGGEDLRLGILQDGYEGLEEPWTGCNYIANNFKRLVDLSEYWFNNNGGSEKKLRTQTTPDPQIISQIKDELPSLTDGMLTSLLEQSRFGVTLENAEQRRLAQDFGKTYQEDRYTKPINLARIGHWDKAARIAKKHESFRGLAVILLEHVESLESDLLQADLSSVDLQVLKTVRASKKTEIEHSFEVYGESFAFPLFDQLLEKHGVEAVMEFDLDKHRFKTKFLRSRPELAKISWINDIQQEKDIDHAADTLITLALSKEQQVWSKKIELSLGKLALLAEAETGTNLEVKADQVRIQGSLARVEKELIAITIQDQLYEQIAPSTREAVDEAAAINFAMDAHGMNIPRRQKASHQIFENGMKRLLKHEALDAMTLIDLLTLSHFKPELRGDLMANPFWLALKVAQSSCTYDELRDARRLIWRRLFIRDDWSQINDTQEKTDVEVSLRLAETELFKMLVDCIRFGMEHLSSEPLDEANLRVEDVPNSFRPMNPREALGVFVDGLDRRFREFDEDFQAKLKDAMKAEDKLLVQYVEKHRLMDWLPSVADAAKLEIQNEFDEATMGDA
ncbi:unnamed protein product [Clonostachys byssicola]|uniref:Nucleoporin NUP133 n=1 Tax=Clonostachys byssicola TaxID=160290 RepID=A0A9N9UX03_9HYPO|nr:unnamed protein product [Clonostachys byssicola]